jgi:hypothetical protein
MRTTIFCVLAAAIIFVRAGDAHHHHSFTAEFDITQPVKVAGTISDMKWSNPHAWVYIDVKDGEGKVVTWAFETQAANALYRNGWRREDVVPGTAVTAEGYRARNGSPTANMRSLVLPDGRRLLAGPPPTAGSR